MRLLLAFAMCAAGCFYTSTSPLPEDFATCPAMPAPAVSDAPTWYRDVQPIAVAKCQGCHVATGIAPFSLETYQDFSALRDSARDAIAAKTMPPWQPDACCNAYRWDRSLDAAELATMLAWFDTGLLVGSPDDAPPPVAPPALALPRVDLHAQMHEAYTPAPANGIDELRCFLLDHDALDRTRYITGFDFQPGVRGEVHHVIVYALDPGAADDAASHDGADGRPGWNCNDGGAEIALGSQYIGGWQPGVTARVLPDGIGRELPAHARIMVSLHYDAGHGVAPDLSRLALMLEDHVDRIEKGIPVGDPLWLTGDGLTVAAGDPDAHVWFAWDPSAAITHGAVEIHDVMLHMHELGSIGRVAILRADGTDECLLNIAKWNFHWMADYYFETPVRLEPGDKLYVECHWDNTAAHQKIFAGVRETPRTLHWGNEDEMCGAVLTYAEAP